FLSHPNRAPSPQCQLLVQGGCTTSNGLLPARVLPDHRLLSSFRVARACLRPPWRAHVLRPYAGHSLDCPPPHPNIELDSMKKTSTVRRGGAQDQRYHQRALDACRHSHDVGSPGSDRRCYWWLNCAWYRNALTEILGCDMASAMAHPL